jgi:hypothetical protein
MPRLIPLLLALLLPAAAHANLTLCFRLADSQDPTLGYFDIKLVTSASCQVAPASQSPRISAVNGTAQGFDQFGSETEGFLLVGTCDARTDFVFLAAVATAGGFELNIFGPSLESGEAKMASIEGPVVPANCGNLDL